MGKLKERARDLEGFEMGELFVGAEDEEEACDGFFGEGEVWEEGESGGALSWDKEVVGEVKLHVFLLNWVGERKGDEGSFSIGWVEAGFEDGFKEKLF